MSEPQKFYLILDDPFNRYWFETVSKLNIVGKTISELDFNNIVGHSIIHYQIVNYRAPYAKN